MESGLVKVVIGSIAANRIAVTRFHGGCHPADASPIVFAYQSDDEEHGWPL